MGPRAALASWSGNEAALAYNGLRDLELTAFLLDELRAHLAAVPAKLRDTHGAKLPIFPTRTGGMLNASNLRGRLLKETVKRVNERREKEGRMLLPEKVTPHTLRRTFASLALAAGRDPRWVMGQLGHTDARLTLNVYAQVMQRHRVDEALIRQLMRFPDEPEERHRGPANETRIETTGRLGATSQGRRDPPANEKTPS
jgi:integrase